jgi:predicted MFS family arabinose efflux permease
MPQLAAGVLPDARLPRPSTLQRNLLLDVSAAVGLGSSMAVVGALFPSVARREGLDSMGLAALAALPFLAALLGLLAGRIGPRTPTQLTLFRAAGSAGLLLVLVAPHPLLIAVAVFGFWASMSLGSPMQQRLWSSMYPTSARGRLLGMVGSSRSAASMLALLAFSFAAAGPGWVGIVALIAIVGIVSAIATSRLAVPAEDADRRYGAADSIATVLHRPMLRKIMAAQLVFGGGLVGASALIALVQVDRLGMSMAQIAIAGLVGAAATTITFSIWGRVAGRVGALITIATGTVLATLAMVAFALAPDVAIVIAACGLLGAGGAAIDVSWPLLIADHADHDEQAAAAAGLGAIMGLRGLITPFVIVAPIQLGLMDETGGLLLCAIATGAGAVIYLRLAGLGRLPGLALGRVAIEFQLWRGRGLGLGLSSVVRPVLQSSPLRALMPASSSSGWPVSLRSRLMRSTMAGWVLKRPMALLSSFLTGLTT